MTVSLSYQGPATLDLLVHNLGRDRTFVTQTRGLTDCPTLDGKKLTGWEMFPLAYDSPPELPKGGPAKKGPAFYKGTFTLREKGETFLDMTKWGFGAVWVNGHNLGRFWEVGPARSLYLPSPWQKVGENEIVVLELMGDKPSTPEIRGTTRLIETEGIPFPEDVRAQEELKKRENLKKQKTVSARSVGATVSACTLEENNRMREKKT